MNKIHFKRKKTANNRGNTMVETLVAFVVLMIVIAALYGMVRISTNLRMRAADSADIQTSFYSEIYKKTPSQNVEPYYYIGKYAPDKKTMFTLKLNTDEGKTSTYNLIKSESGDLSPYTGFSKSLRIPCIDATGYVSTDSRINEENLVSPKALLFSYHK